MLSVAPNIVFVPNITQNAERKHRTQNTNTAPIRPPSSPWSTFMSLNALLQLMFCLSLTHVSRYFNFFSWLGAATDVLNYLKIVCT